MDLLFNSSLDAGKDTELNNFLSRVDEISKIMEGLTSNNEGDQERALRKADILLGDKGSGDTVTGDDPDTKITSDRTIVTKVTDGPSGDMDQTAFMRSLEHDAAARYKERCECKKKSDEFRAKGNEYFKKRSYAQALDNYNKAIDLVRDSPCLYTNRALTWIRVGIPSKALDDLNLTLDLNPCSLKGRLLKARALFNLSEPQLCRDWLSETKTLHPDNTPMIAKYEHDLFELTMELNSAFDEENDRREKKHKGTSTTTGRLHEVTAPEVTWLKAARGQFGKEDTTQADLDD